LSGSLSRGLARLSAVQDTKVARARSVLAQRDPAIILSSPLSPVNLPATETPPSFPRSRSTSSLTSGNLYRQKFLLNCFSSLETLEIVVVMNVTESFVSLSAAVKKDKDSPYWITERRVPELIPVLSSSLQVT